MVEPRSWFLPDSCLRLPADLPSAGRRVALRQARRFSRGRLLRLADILGISVSRSTVLRLVDAMPDPQPPSLHVASIDEYVMRKGRVYGTVLVYVETRRPAE